MGFETKWYRSIIRAMWAGSKVGGGSVWLDLQTLTATWLYGVVNETESCNLQLHCLSVHM